ncbi:MAG TPA: CpsD/CapB family tyrosine-protein kinase [candidate division Zixibacteria bacterium]|nr:CpsD/CapB family tyrosine-protein kinase [candidate division Zixibacteria bacterium]
MKRKRLSVIDAFALESPFATEFRRLLYKLEQARGDRELKSLLMTSAMLSEGKSTASAFLAITAATHKGMNTLLIDCDLRRPSIHKLFALDREPGLSEVLVEGYGPRDAVHHTSIDKLDIMTCGRMHDTPTEIFDAEAIGVMVEQMKLYYDLILLDAAPILPVSDPMLLSSKVDGVILVIKAGATQKDVILRAVDVIDPGRRNILGVVLNNMNSSLPSQYDYRYYGYDYKPSKPEGKAPPRVRKRGEKKSRRQNEQDTYASDR